MVDDKMVFKEKLDKKQQIYKLKMGINLIIISKSIQRQYKIIDLIIIYMQLIEYVLSQQKHNQSITQFKQLLLYNSDLQFYTLLQNPIDFKICFLLQKIDLFNILAQLTIPKNYTTFSIKTILTNTLIFTFNHKLETSFMTRILLKLNSKLKHLYFKINPSKGQIQLIFSLNINLIDLTVQKLEEYKDIINFIKPIIVTQYQKILQILKNTSDKNQENNSFPISKSLLISSSFYSWNILQGENLAFNQRNSILYKKTKRSFQNKKFQHKESNINTIYKNLNIHPIQDIQNCNILSEVEDKQLKDKYLQNSMTIIKNSNQIQDIPLTREAFQFLKKRKQIKINCHRFGQIKIAYQNYQGQNVDKLNYQRKILGKLPKTQFIGIPKFFNSRNLQQQTRNCRLSNLVFVIPWLKYLNKNKATLSIYTLYSITNQISIILKYLRDSNIIFHNLTPRSIVIKKNLLLNFTDFSNAYHQTLFKQLQSNQNQKYRPAKDILPYVYNYKFKRNKTEHDEKADVYNFGVFIYELFYSQTPHHIKQSSLNKPQILHKLLKAPLFALQKTQMFRLQIFKPWIYILLQSCWHIFQKNEKNCDKQRIEYYNEIINESNSQFPLTERRPFLDWICIITKHVLEYTQGVS